VIGYFKAPDADTAERGAGAKTENQDRYKGKENRYHDRDGTAGSRKSPASQPCGDFESRTAVCGEAVVMTAIGANAKSAKSA
jgi:hypothetical protein